MRTTLAAMALTVLSLAGCAGNRCNCTCSSPCTSPCLPPAPATYKPCVTCTVHSPAPKAASIASSSPYTTTLQVMPPIAAPTPRPDARSPWPSIATPAVTSAPSQASAPKVAPAAAPPPLAPVGRDNPERQLETPTTELPEPAKLPERPSNPEPRRPMLPEAPAHNSPEALNLGQSPEPEVAPNIQTTGATEEPTPIAQTPLLRPAESVQVLTGVVESWRKTWRLRYAPVDVEDVHGGRVTLIGSALDRLREGQRVRVHGVLIPTADRGSAPTFDVQAIEVVD